MDVNFYGITISIYKNKGLFLFIDNEIAPVPQGKTAPVHTQLFFRFACAATIYYLNDADSSYYSNKYMKLCYAALTAQPPYLRNTKHSPTQLNTLNMASCVDGTDESKEHSS